MSLVQKPHTLPLNLIGLSIFAYTTAMMVSVSTLLSSQCTSSLLMCVMDIVLKFLTLHGTGGAWDPVLAPWLAAEFRQS